MKLWGRRRNKSDGELEPRHMLHEAQRHHLGRKFKIYAVTVNPKPWVSKTRHYFSPRIRLIIVSDDPGKASLYERLELHFNAEEVTYLELKLVQALGTRKVRKDAKPLTRLTRHQAREPLI